MKKRMDGLTDNQREPIIPRHYCVAGYKKRNFFEVGGIMISWFISEECYVAELRFKLVAPGSADMLPNALCSLAWMIDKQSRPWSDAIFCSACLHQPVCPQTSGKTYGAWKAVISLIFVHTLWQVDSVSSVLYLVSVLAGELVPRFLALVGMF